MTEELQILVTIQVDADAEKLSAKDKLSATDAIRHAVKHMEEVGFVHSREGQFSIGVVAVENVTGREERLVALQRRLDEVKRQASAVDNSPGQLTNEGVELSDGGIIEIPDDDGTIRRRDVHGNCEEVRRPGDDGYELWKALFSS